MQWMAHGSDEEKVIVGGVQNDDVKISLCKNYARMCANFPDTMVNMFDGCNSEHV